MKRPAVHGRKGQKVHCAAGTSRHGAAASHKYEVQWAGVAPRAVTSWILGGGLQRASGGCPPLRVSTGTWYRTYSGGQGNLNGSAPARGRGNGPWRWPLGGDGICTGFHHSAKIGADGGGRDLVLVACCSPGSFTMHPVRGWHPRNPVWSGACCKMLPNVLGGRHSRATTYRILQCSAEHSTVLRPVAGTGPTTWNLQLGTTHTRRGVEQRTGVWASGRSQGLRRAEGGVPLFRRADAPQAPRFRRDAPRGDPGADHPQAR